MAVIVVKKDGESIDSLLRRFKTKFKESNVLKDYFDRQHFVKPSKQRKEKKRLAITRQKKLKKPY